MAKIIYIEGPKGSGKSTTTRRVEKVLIDKGYTVIVLTEPGGTDNSPMALAIRELLKSDTPRSRECEALLFQASRIELYNKDIKPFIDDDIIFLIDRSIMSSLVTQFHIHGVDFVPDMHRITSDGYSADLCFWLLPTEEVIDTRLTLRDDNYDIINEHINRASEYDGYAQISHTMSTIGEVGFAKGHVTLVDPDLEVNTNVIVEAIGELSCVKDTSQPTG